MSIAGNNLVYFLYFLFLFNVLLVLTIIDMRIKALSIMKTL